jgi:hypothetical protein
MPRYAESFREALGADRLGWEAELERFSAAQTLQCSTRWMGKHRRHCLSADASTRIAQGK